MRVSDVMTKIGTGKLIDKPRRKTSYRWFRRAEAKDSYRAAKRALQQAKG